jgi:ribosomal protein S8E
MICCEVSFNLISYSCVDPSQGATCPVGCPSCTCASPDTPIATPDGDRAIATLRVGDIVYSVDHGRVAAVPIREVHQAAAHHHFVMRAALSNGSVIEVSAPHPTADGRLFGDLRAGDFIGGVSVESVTRVPYRFAHTYDILPESDTGAYFAGGVLIGSTLGGSTLSSGSYDDSLLSMPR